MSKKNLHQSTTLATSLRQLRAQLLEAHPRMKPEKLQQLYVRKVLQSPELTEEAQRCTLYDIVDDLNAQPISEPTMLDRDMAAFCRWKEALWEDWFVRHGGAEEFPEHLHKMI